MSMLSTWEDVAKDLEVDYIKAKEALEESWEENERLEGVISQQHAEIVALRVHLASKEALKENWNEIDRLERFNAQLENEIKSLKVQLEPASLPCEVWTKQRVGASVASTCVETLSVLSPSASTREEVEYAEEDENRPSPALYKKLRGTHLVKDSPKREDTKENRRDALLERDRRIIELETKMKALKEKHEESVKQNRILESENRHREEQLMNLQCQLAEYMLNEAANPLVGPITAEWPLKSSESPFGSQDDMWPCQMPAEEKHDDDDDDDDESSLKVRDLENNASMSSTTSLASSIFQKCSISLGASFSRPAPGDPTEAEKELLRQLHFLQKESRFERADLEREIQERDNVIKKYERTIMRQEETIRNLERS